MVSVLVCGTLLYLHVASGDRYLRKLFSRVSYPKNVIIEIPTTIEGNLEARYLGISPNFTSQEAIDWWEKHEPHYQKFVTEQIRLEEEAKAKQPPRTPPNTEEILASLGDWGHYYDYKTKEIISWERRNPPAINQMPLIDHYKELKAMALEKQRLRALNRTTDFYPGMKDQMAKMKLVFFLQFNTCGLVVSIFIIIGCIHTVRLGLVN